MSEAAPIPLREAGPADGDRLVDLMALQLADPTHAP